MPRAVSYSLPEGTGPEDLIALLSERLEVADGGATTADRLVLDTADRRLRRAGLELARAGGELVLSGEGAPAMSRPAGRRARYLLEDLPEGPLRDRLAGIVEMRALLPVARIRSRVRRLGVLDADQKTTVRLELETAQAAAEGRSEPLGTRLHVRGVLGYDKQLAAAERVIANELGLARAEGTVADDAVRALGGDPRGIQGRVRIELDPEMRADEAAVRLLEALADVTEANLPGTLDDVDTEFLHQFRVSLRRARSVLRELRDVFPPGGFARHRAELRWIQSATGPLRDLDVQVLEWDELVQRIPGAARADLTPLRDLLLRRRERELRAMRRALRGRRFVDEWAAWRAFLRGPLGPEADRPDAARPVSEVAARRIARVYRRMVRDGSRIGDSSPAEDLHELRKRGKELRYLLELFGGLYPAEVVGPMVASLKELQSVLGLHQDRAVQAQTLRELAHDVSGRPGGPDALLALGVVIERLDTEQHEARTHFAERFDAFASKGRRRSVRRTFGGKR